MGPALLEPLLLPEAPRRGERRCFNGGTLYAAAATLCIAVAALTLLSASSGRPLQPHQLGSISLLDASVPEAAAARSAAVLQPVQDTSLRVALHRLDFAPETTSGLETNSAAAEVLSTKAEQQAAHGAMPETGHEIETHVSAGSAQKGLKHKETCAEGFPPDFVWGLGTAAYQIEGGVRLFGREPSIWDTFSHTPGKTFNGSTGDVACDHIHRWPQDVALMSSIGLKHYRLSLSWSRVMSWDNGNKKMVPNEPGISFYRTLLEALHKAGITAYVTLYHWDLPQVHRYCGESQLTDMYGADADRENGCRLVVYAAFALTSPLLLLFWPATQVLHDEMGGWHTPDNEAVLREFDEYARLSFQRFGDLVAMWMTFNEPWTFTVAGYSAGNHAPGCAPFQDSELPCSNGDRAPYIVAHNVLNAHARASAIYRSEFQLKHGGKISITFPCEISTGLTNSEADASAAEVANEFFLGWWLQPLVSGDYPAAMRERVGERLPRFTPVQAASLQQSIDVLSLNHYSTHLVSATAAGDAGDTSSGWMADQRIRSTFGKGWPASASPWQHAYPPGIRMLLRWASKRWKGPMYITENGWSCNSMSKAEATRDEQQLDYFKNYTEQVRLMSRRVLCPEARAGSTHTSLWPHSGSASND